MGFEFRVSARKTFLSPHTAQWSEHLTGDQKVAGSIPVWGSETFF